MSSVKIRGNASQNYGSFLPKTLKISQSIWELSKQPSNSTLKFDAAKKAQAINPEIANIKVLRSISSRQFLVEKQIDDDMTNFKLRLHKNQVDDSQSPQKSPLPSTFRNQDHRLAMKGRLESKILQANEKLQELKVTFELRQQEKREIINNSDTRRSVVQ